MSIRWVGTQMRGKGWWRNRWAFITWTETETCSSGKTRIELSSPGYTLPVVATVT